MLQKEERKGEKTKTQSKQTNKNKNKTQNTIKKTYWMHTIQRLVFA
jgi:hypothetical protein